MDILYMKEKDTQCVLNLS